MKFLVPKARWWWRWRYEDDSDYDDDGADVDADGSGGGDLGDHHVWQLLYVLWDRCADTVSWLSHRCLWLCYRPSPTTTSKKSWSSFFARWTGLSSQWGGITFWLWVDLFLLSSISNWVKELICWNTRSRQTLSTSCCFVLDYMGQIFPTWAGRTWELTQVAEIKLDLELVYQDECTRWVEPLWASASSSMTGGRFSHQREAFCK